MTATSCPFVGGVGAGAGGAGVVWSWIADDDWGLVHFGGRQWAR
jgi:hypothetical protein